MGASRPTRDNPDRPHASGPVHRPELDALRFAAFFLVFLHHVLPRRPDAYGWAPLAVGRSLAAVANACGFGLSLFFTLSAFLITDLLLRERALTGGVDLRAFYLRRILRIWPLYTVGLLIGVLAALCPPQRDDLVMIGLDVVLAGNVFFIGASTWSGNPATPLWSLSIEEQFYLFWPLAVRLCAGRHLHAACGALAACAVAAQVALGLAHAELDTTVWTNSLVQFEAFAAGAAVAIRLRGSTPSLPRLSRALLAGHAGVAWLAAVTLFSTKAIGPAPSASALVAGYALVTLGAVALLASALGARLPRTSPWVRLGRISFGLYVFHLLFIEAARGFAPLCPSPFDPRLTSLLLQLCSLAPTVAVAVLSHRTIEQPFLRLKARLAVVGNTGAGSSPGQPAASTAWRCSPNPSAPIVTTSPALR